MISPGVIRIPYFDHIAEERMWMLILMLIVHLVTCQESSNTNESKGTDAKASEPLFAFASPLTGLGPVDPDPFGMMSTTREKGSLQIERPITMQNDLQKKLSISELLAQAENAETKVDVSRVDQDILNVPNGKERASKVSDISTVSKPFDKTKLNNDIENLKNLIDPALEAQILGFKSETKILKDVNNKAKQTIRSVTASDVPMNAQSTFTALTNSNLFGTNSFPRTVLESTNNNVRTNDFFSVTPSPVNNLPFSNDFNAGNSLITNDPKVINTDSAVAASIPQQNSNNIGDPSNVFGDVNIPIDFPLFPDINSVGPPASGVGTSATNVLGPINGQFLTSFQGNFNGLNNFQTGSSQFNSALRNASSEVRNQLPASSNDMNLQIGGVTSAAGMSPVNNRPLTSEARMANGFPPNVNLGSAILQINQRGGNPFLTLPGIGLQRPIANSRNTNFANILSSGNFQGTRQGFGGPVVQQRAQRQFGTNNLQSFSTTNNFDQNSLSRGNTISNSRRGQSNQILSDLIPSRRLQAVSPNRNSVFQTMLNRRSNGATNRNFIDSLDGARSLFNFPPLRSPSTSTADEQGSFDFSASNGNMVPRTMNDFRWNLSRRPFRNPVTSANRALFARIGRFSNRLNNRPRFRSGARSTDNPLMRSSMPRFQPIPVDQFDSMFTNRVNGARNSRVGGQDGNRVQLSSRFNLRRNTNQLPLIDTQRPRSSSVFDPSIRSQGALQDAVSFSLPSARSNIAGDVRDSDRRLFLQEPLINTFFNTFSNNRDVQTVPRRRTFSRIRDNSRRRSRPNTVEQNTFDVNRRQMRQPSVGNGFPPFIPFRADVANFITPAVLLSDAQMKPVIKERLKSDSKPSSVKNKQQPNRRSNTNRNRNVSSSRTRNIGS